MHSMHSPYSIRCVPFGNYLRHAGSCPCPYGWKTPQMPRSWAQMVCWQGARNPLGVKPGGFFVCAFRSRWVSCPAHQQNFPLATSRRSTHGRIWRIQPSHGHSSLIGKEHRERGHQQGGAHTLFVATGRGCRGRFNDRMDEATSWRVER